MSTRSRGLGEQCEPSSRDTIDLAQGSGVEVANSTGMEKHRDQEQRSEKPTSTRARLEDARRAAEEYAADLREIIRSSAHVCLIEPRGRGCNVGCAVELARAAAVAWPRQQ